jgi:hypothetical protein
MLSIWKIIPVNGNEIKMHFVLLAPAFAEKRSDEQPGGAGRRVGIADLEKDFDRTSEAFIDAAHLFERCPPKSFGM